jgi:hypothetical protein
MEGPAKGVVGGWNQAIAVELILQRKVSTKASFEKNPIVPPRKSNGRSYSSLWPVECPQVH